MLKHFRSYQLAIQFYRRCEKIRGAQHLQSQLLRGSSSIALNLAEGSERVTDADRRRFYRMAMGSIRECQAILDLIGPEPVTEDARKIADQLGAAVFKLCKSIDLKILPNRSRELGAESREPETDPP
jgi:four helix bundle protein